jgi:hypothetical protein
MPRPRILLPAVAILIAIVGLAEAQEEEPPDLITDRPDQTESAAVVPRGLYQFEIGYTHLELDAGDAGTVRVDELPQTLARLGLSNRFELRLGFSGYRVVEIPGTDGDSEKGARPKMALLAGTTIPTGDSELTSSRFDGGFRMAFSNTLTERLSLGYNAGVAWATEEDDTGDRDTVSTFQWTAALGIGATERLSAFVELFGGTGLSARESDVWFDGGITYLIRPNLQWDLSGGPRLDGSGDWFVGTGISFRLPR